MKIINTFPPNIEKIKKAFPISETTVFTYGDAIYNPHNGYIDPPLMVHESVHSKNQLNNFVSPEVWWDRYITDKEFRINEELEAYRAQYKEAKRLLKDRNVLNRFLMNIAADLSGPMYGSVVSMAEAMKLIKYGN